jgi:hypothetical protein
MIKKIGYILIIPVLVFSLSLIDKYSVVEPEVIRTARGDLLG